MSIIALSHVSATWKCVFYWGSARVSTGTPDRDPFSQIRAVALGKTACGCEGPCKSQGDMYRLYHDVAGFLALTPARLFLSSQEDLFKETEQQNIPGISNFTKCLKCIAFYRSSRYPASGIGLINFEQRRNVEGKSVQHIVMTSIIHNVLVCTQMNRYQLSWHWYQYQLIFLTYSAIPDELRSFAPICSIGIR